jgi:CubicO group peptidase (beta-lactamase class C family)
MILRRSFTTGLVAAASLSRPLGPALSLEVDPLQAAIDDAIAEERIVGTVVLIAHKGRIVYERAAGLADREIGRAMTLETPFRLASLTKPYTTLATLRLFDQGTLSPEQRLADWLPTFAKHYGAVTLDQLLSHTAGFDYGFQQSADGSYHRAGISDGMDEKTLSLEDNIARIASVPPDREPGTGWRYSVATDILGAVIAAATKQPLPDAIAALVTQPLGIRTTFHWTGEPLAAPYRDGETAPVLMTGVTEVPLPFVEGPGVRFDPDRATRAIAFPSGGGGMIGRAHEVLAVLESFRNGSMLSPTMRDAAQAARVGIEAAPQGPGWGVSWLGPVLLDPRIAGTGLSAGTVSWGGVYGHMWAMDFAKETTLLSLSNTAFEGMFGRYPQALKAALFPGG